MGRRIFFGEMFFFFFWVGLGGGSSILSSSNTILNADQIGWSDRFVF